MTYQNDITGMLNAVFNLISPITIDGKIYPTMPYIFPENESIFIWPEIDTTKPYTIGTEEHDVEVRILTAIRSHDRSAAAGRVREIVGEVVNALMADYTATGTAESGMVTQVDYDYEPKGLLRHMTLMDRNEPVKYGMVRITYQIIEEV